MKLLGRSVSSAVEAINSICDHDHCAVHIAERLYRYFVGIPPDDTTLNRLASTFRAGGLEIKPLVEAILRDNSFMNNRMTRPRFPIEWYVASNAVLGFSGDPNTLELLGQQPFMPPNVAGWPVSNRWLSAGAAFTHAHTAWDHAGDTEVIDSDDPVTVVLEKAGLHEVSAETRTALAAAIATIDQRRDRATVLHALVVCCPEFALA